MSPHPPAELDALAATLRSVGFGYRLVPEASGSPLGVVAEQGSVFGAVARFEPLDMEGPPSMDITCALWIAMKDGAWRNPVESGVVVFEESLIAHNQPRVLVTGGLDVDIEDAAWHLLGVVGDLAGAEAIDLIVGKNTKRISNTGGRFFCVPLLVPRAKPWAYDTKVIAVGR